MRVVMKFSPIFDRVIVKPTVVDITETDGGVMLPSTLTREKPIEGTVLAIGGDVTHLEAGDRVVFSKYAGTEIVVDSEQHLILREEDILAIVHDDKEEDSDGNLSESSKEDG